MRTIFKYPLPDNPQEQEIEMPIGFIPLNIQLQFDVPVLWVEIVDKEPEYPTRKVKILAVETGAQFSSCDPWRYLGTLQFLGGSYVLHYFYYEIN